MKSRDISDRFAEDLIKSAEEKYGDQFAHSFVAGYLEARIGSILSNLEMKHPEAYNDTVETFFEKYK